MTDISYKGANCILIQTKQASMVVDPKVPGVKLSKIVDKARVQLVTQPQFGVDTSSQEQMTISLPGEYEVGEFSVVGVDAAAQLDPASKSVMYRVVTPDAVVGVIGHVNPDTITDEQLETLGFVDVLVLPVGGNGYTIDPHGAAKLTQRISPKVVIPVHFKEDGVAYEVPQLPIENFTKELGAIVVKEPQLRIKNAQLPDVLSVYELARTA